MSLQTMSLDRYELPTGEAGKQHSSPSSSSYQRSKRSSRAAPVVVSHSSSTVMREQTNETSLSVLIWHPTAAQTSSGSALSKAPILRDVPLPQVRRKLGRRDRDSAPTSFFESASGSTGSPSISYSDPKSFASLKSAAPSWLREKPSKAKLASGSVTQQRAGVWRRATLTMRETGVLLILGDDRAMLHSISASDLSVSDVRLVDDSLFNRPYVLGIFAQPSTLTAGIRSPFGQSKANAPASAASSPFSVASARTKDEPIYICFPTSRKLYSWRSLLRIFAKPEIYGPANGTKPKGTHRCYRQVDLIIHEIKLFADRGPPYSSSMMTAERGRRTSGVASPASPEADEGHITKVTSSLANASANATDQTITAQISVTTKRTSMESASRALGSVMERITTRDNNGLQDVKHLSQQDDTFDDSKSSMSADDIANASGPITGQSSSRPVDITTILGGGVDMDRRGSDGSSHNVHAFNVQPSACFCQVWMDGEVVARSKVCNGTASIVWDDKFSLQDLPHLGALHIEVLQAWRPTKFVVLGFIDIPLETMRRGETVEGWYPIWALPRLEDAWSRRDERSASYTREMVGELKVVLNVFDETILPSSNYADISAMLNGEGAVDLARRLCKELEEDRIVSHLVDVYTTGGTIVERLSDLTKAESAAFGVEPTLLFRGNTLLSRAIDKYQRKYCSDWLVACVGPTVQKICSERIKLEPGEASPVLAPTGLGGIQSSSAASSYGHDDASLEMLKSLSEDLWKTIYAHRHKCPPDLRRALATIRRTVNAHYNSVQGPGVQGVGAFVFLRLICPAITSPNLYGLMSVAPDPASAKTLMLLAKVFLALANKRQSFDKDKEPWLVKLNDFLHQQASAYDDFISIVSSEPEEGVKAEPLGDEKDLVFQRVVHHRMDGLLPLHRESVPQPGLRLDNARALASLVSYIVRGASADPYDEHAAALPSDSTSLVNSHKDQARAVHNSRNSDSELVNDFVDMCCDVEDLVGYHLDRAGFRPDPIQTRDDVGGVFRTTSVFTAAKGASPLMTSTVNAGNAHGSGRISPIKSVSMVKTNSSGGGSGDPSSTPLQYSDAASSIRLRRATVSGEGRIDSSDEGSQSFGPYRPKMSYIGEDSFLRSQIPAKFINSSGDASNEGSDWDATAKNDRIASSALEEANKSSSYEFHHRGSTDGHRRRQSAFSPASASQLEASAAAKNMGNTLKERDTAQYEWTTNSNGHKSSEADSKALTEEFYRAPSSVSQSYDRPSSGSGTRVRSGTVTGAEDAKKKRGWWRRLK